MGDCPHDDSSPHYGAIAEGGCPRCGITMGRHGDHGRCPCCDGCWSASGDTIVLVIHGAVRPSASGGFRFGPGDVRITRPTEERP